MAFATIQFSPRGRRCLGIALTVLTVIQTLVGISILGCGIYFMQNLQWRTSVVASSYNSSTLGMTVLIVGGIITLLHLCAAKIFYDSGKEETRHRFDCLLFPLVVFFIFLMIVEFAMGISCKVHYDSDIKHFRTGFIKAMEEYSTNRQVKETVDRLQSHDECCGADSFLDWVENDWVAPDFNPLVNGKVAPYLQSVYYPWKISKELESPSPSDSDVKPDNSYSYENGGPYTADRPTVNIRKPPPYDRRPRVVRRRLKRSDDAEEEEEESRHERRMKLLSRIQAQSKAQYRHLRASEPMYEKNMEEAGAENQFPLQQSDEDRERNARLWVVPWSCCSVNFEGPCIHDYVTQKYLVTDLHAKDSWKGESLYQFGCAQLLKSTNNRYLTATSVLFVISFVIQLILLVCGRYLQTTVEGVDLYNREDNSSPGFLLTCTWFGDPNNFSAGDPRSKVKRKGKNKSMGNFIRDDEDKGNNNHNDDTVDDIGNETDTDWSQLGTKQLLDKASSYLKKHKRKMKEKLQRKLQRKAHKKGDDNEQSHRHPLMSRSIEDEDDEEMEEETQALDEMSPNEAPSNDDDDGDDDDNHDNEDDENERDDDRLDEREQVNVKMKKNAIRQKAKTKGNSSKPKTKSQSKNKKKKKKSPNIKKKNPGRKKNKK